MLTRMPQGISVAYGQPLEEEAAFKLLDKTIELGCTFWDSADVYGDNSERLQRYFAKAGNRDKVVSVKTLFQPQR